MSRSRSWLGKLGGLLAACLVIAMAAGPMIDSVTCQGDGDDKAAAVALVDQPATADAGPDTGKINTGDRPSTLASASTAIATTAFRSRLNRSRSLSSFCPGPSAC
jgi:hypothetical protein